MSCSKRRHQVAGDGVLFFFLDRAEAGVLMRHEDVFGHAQVGVEIQFLIDDADAVMIGIARGTDMNGLPVHEQLTGGCLLNARQNFHQGRFARAVFADQDVHLTAINVEIDILEGDGARIDFGDLFGLQQQFGRRLGHDALTVRIPGTTTMSSSLSSVNAPANVTCLPVRLVTSPSGVMIC